MKTIDLKPLRSLIDRHTFHRDKYEINFKGIDLVIYPGVLNPNYTKVSGFLSDNIKIKPGSRVLDMFCGSGAIGILNAKNAQSVLFSDISPEAIKCTEDNLSKFSVKGKVSSRLSDVWNNIANNELFDVIIANPPLLPISPNTEFERNFADSKNMDITTRFIKGCPQHLTKNGTVYMATSTASNLDKHKSREGDIAVTTAQVLGLKADVVAELNAGYEIYRVIKLSL